MVINSGLDSLTICTPLRYFRAIDDRLTDHVIEIFEETGEITEQERKRIPLRINDKGIKIRCQVFKRFKETYVFCTLNSRILRENVLVNGYFQFLTWDKSDNILKLINNYFKYEIDTDLWLECSTVYDCDFASDFRELQLEFELRCSDLKQIPTSKLYFASDTTVLQIDKKVIVGLTINNRKNGSIKHPFCKIYTKYHELRSRSNVFWESYIFSFNDKNYRRAEVTVRNRKHFNSLYKKGILNHEFENEISLLSVMKLNPEQCDKIVRFMFSQYYLKKIKRRHILIEDEIRPSDFFIGKLIETILDEGYPIEYILNIMDKYETSNDEKKKTYKSRIKKRVTKILERIYEPVLIEKKLPTSPDH